MKNMSREGQMIDKLIEMNKQMKETQEQVSNYIIKQTKENTWVVLNESEEIVNTITKDIVVNYCKNECEITDTNYMSADEITDSVWWYINDEHNLELVDNYCQEFDKFLAWFDYICVEFLAQKIVGIYKQRLLNWE